MENIKAIQCPDCGRTIDVNEALSHHLQEEFQSKYNQKLLDVRKQYDEKYTELNKLNEALRLEKENIGDTIQKGIQEKLALEKSKLEKNLRNQIADEKSDEIKSYRDQLEEKIQEVKSLNKLKADFQRLQREKDELKPRLEAEMEKKITEMVNAEREKLKNDADSQTFMKLAEKELIITQLQEQLKSAQRKAESGSTRIQGEAQELVIEEYLRESFPTDTIKEVKKGMRGADCLQIVNNGASINCGCIYYESKRTKEFQKSWLDKFKTDMRQVKATFGVLVTECLPKDMKRFGLRDGIWICTFEEFKGLCFVLRDFCIQLYNAQSVNEDRGGKMETLYTYLTGSEFRMHLEAIVEGFVEMEGDLSKERRAMEASWKQRQKQIQKVIVNTTQMYGSIKGIAGKSIITIKSLELPPKGSSKKSE